MIANKKAQVTVWTIIAIAVIATIVLLSMIIFKPKKATPETTNPQAFMQKCVRDATYEIVNKILPQGGFLEPNNYKVWNGLKVSYLCRNDAYYDRCINQHPAFIREVEKEIYDYVKPRIENCFNQIKTEWGKRGEAVTLGEMNLSVNLAQGLVIINLKRETKINKEEEYITFKDYSSKIPSSIYDLANVANIIAEQQAKYCYFEYVGFMTLYPRWEIEVYTFDDSTRIYTIKDIDSGKEINIAIRGCAIPAGA